MNTELTPTVFAATRVRKQFGPVVALNEVDFELRAGEVTALMGENGAGKSTLLKILTGDYQPDSGHVSLDGATVTFHSPADAHAAGVRVIAQEPEILQHISVAENIYIGRISARGPLYDRSALERQVTEDLVESGFDRVISATMRGGDLSPAQRQIVEIMRSVISEPRVICFDEPTSSLGDEEVGILFALIRKLRDQGKAVGYVSHRMSEIFQLSDRITVLRDGALVGTRLTAETDNAELVRMMVGRDLSQLFQRDRQQPGREILSLTNVGTADVDDITLTVKAGEVVGVAGLIGAGRSELMKAIVGDVRVESGEVRVDGETVHFRSPADAIAAGIGFAPEERKAEALLLQRTVRDNISLAILPRISRAFFVKSRLERDIAKSFISQLSIRTPSPEQLAKNLSGGNQQKVVLARWLAYGPKLLVLDEPTRGVDVGAKAEIYTIIDTLAQSGVAVLIVSSELPEVLGVSDRIYVMAGGRIVGTVDHADATEESILAMAMTDADDHVSN
ncbi:MAG: sugar ABC transporter ATP-binding protein [Actinomycetota bacterium]|nr:sugar ABC transporter ATP-binding protein [Actinomycetota bacterium]